MNINIRNSKTIKKGGNEYQVTIIENKPDDFILIINYINGDNISSERAGSVLGDRKKISSVVGRVLNDKIQTIGEVIGNDGWLNKREVKHKHKHKHRYQSKKSATHENISIMGLIESGELERAGYLDEVVKIENGGDWEKVTLKVGGKNITFALQQSSNVISDWRAGSEFNGRGAVKFMSSLFGLGYSESVSFLSKLSGISEVDPNEQVSRFKNAIEKPYLNQSYNIETPKSLIAKNRSFSDETVNEMVKRGAIGFSGFLRVPTDEKRKEKKGDPSLPRKDVFYFPLKRFGDSEPISYQYIQYQKDDWMKLNLGSTKGVGLSIGNRCESLIITEAAFDAIALYEIMKVKNINPDDFNIVSGQSVGGAVGYIQNIYNVGFKKNHIGNFEVVGEREVNYPLQGEEFDVFVDNLRSEVQNDGNNRSFYVFFKSDGVTPSGDLVPETLEFMLKNKIITSKDIKPIQGNFRKIRDIDVVLNSSSIGSFLERNSLALDGNIISPVRVVREEFELTEDYINKTNNKIGIRNLISACDRDSAGDGATQKIKLVADKFGLNFLDVRPDIPHIVDHNNALRAYKGKNIKGVNINNIKKDEVLSYVDDLRLVPTTDPKYTRGSYKPSN